MDELSEIKSLDQLSSEAKKAHYKIVAVEQASPELALWESIRLQLEFISQAILNKRPPTSAEKTRIIMGVQADREINDLDRPLASQLIEIDYAFKRWELLAK